MKEHDGCVGCIYSSLEHEDFPCVKCKGTVPSFSEEHKYRKDYWADNIFQVTKQDSNNMVEHPEHYTRGSMECIVVIEAITKGLNDFEAYCTGTILKYLWRWKWKNGVEDLKKAKKYIEFLIEHLEDGHV